MKEINYTDKEQQVFVCADKGHLTRFKLKTKLEKQEMYNSYPISIQTGLRCANSLKLSFDDGSFKIINPSNLKFDKSVCISSRKKIITLSLEGFN